VDQNLNPDFNVVRLQTIMELIQHLAPQNSLLVALAQQGAKAVGQIITAKPSVRNHRGKPSVGNRFKDRVKCARSEEAYSASGNRHLAKANAHRRITQNRQ
jgi:hypothetical protein